MSKSNNEFGISKSDENGGIGRIIWYIFIIIVLVVGGYFIYDKFLKEKNLFDFKKDNEVVETNKEEDSKEDVIFTSYQLEEYLSYVPLLTETIELTDAYSGNLVTIENINKEVYLDYIFNLSNDVTEAMDTYSQCGEEECSGSKNVLISEFNNNLKKYYNIDKNEIFNFGCGIEKGEKHYGSFCERGRYKWNKIGKYIKNEVIDEQLIIYEQAGFYTSDLDNYYIYKDSNSDDKWANFYEKKSLDISNIEEYITNKLRDFNTFKHTFKKNGDTYYWYSTELVNSDNM